MGGEFGQWREWTETESLDWHLLDDSLHSGVQRLIRDLNHLYLPDEALWQADGEPSGFEWLDVDNAAENILSFLRRSPQTGKELICVANFSAVPRNGYRLKREGVYKILINTDDEKYGGSATAVNLNSASIDLPPLTTLWLEIQSPLSK